MKKKKTIAALVVICLIESSKAVPTEKPVATDKPQASKDVKDAIKRAKEEQKTKQNCRKACTDIYDPVCAHDPTNTGNKPRSFGSQCVLDVHNCEMGTKLVVKSKGACPGSEGIRL
uniref:Kazal-like domain-containing protein n=1 Tax=Trichogramma kaykai TaxID=54128 RepID=A0ABD2XFG7_9HYME